MIMKVGFIISLHQYTFSTGSAMADWNFFLIGYYSHIGLIRYRKGGKCVFGPPLFGRPLFTKEPRHRRKKFGVVFFKKLTVFVYVFLC